jgi:hypothetical protein
MANQPTAVESIDARIQGEVSGQVAVGTHILQIGSVHGGIVNVAVPGEEPRPKARLGPIHLRPRPFPGILDRTEESGAAIRALDSGQSVEVFGQPGMGKTVLLRHLAHKIDSEHFREGIIYRETHDDPPGDVLQVLWGDFFECNLPFKPTDSQLRSDLQGKQALVILDAVELSRAGVEQVMNIAAGCTFLLGSLERHLWGDDTQARHLAGLPAKDATTLVEREFGRPLTEDEVLAVERLTLALKGNPLRLLQEVAMARLSGRSLASVAEDLQSDASPEKLTASVTTPLSDEQRRMLSALAIFSGASVRPTMLGELLQVNNAETILEELKERHLVRTTEGGYRLVGEFAALEDTEADEGRKRAVVYFADWIGKHQRDVKTILATLPALMYCLRWALKFGLAAEVMRITKSLEFTLVLNGRWESWANALRLAGQSAIAAKDKAALGWVCHQTGTKALCDGNLPEARESFKQALHIREALRDKAGAVVTRHNLNLVAPIAVPPWKIWTVPAGIAAVVCTFIAAMVFASKIPNLWHPTRTRTLTTTTTSAPVRPSSATMALTSSAPSGPTRAGPSGHRETPISPSLPPVIPPAGPAPPEPPQTWIPPYFPPSDVWRPIEVPGIIVWVPPKHRHHDDDTGKEGSDGNPGKRGGDGNAGTKGDNPPKTPEVSQFPGKKKKGSGRGTANRSPDGSEGTSNQRQSGTHKSLPSAGHPSATGGGQGKPENPSKKGSPATGSHVGVPPPSIRTNPYGPRSWPPNYTPPRTFKTRRNPSAPPLIH